MFNEQLATLETLENSDDETRGANAICDILTIVLTIQLLEAAAIGRIQIWQALVANIALAATLAMLSLWAGSAWSRASYSWHEVWLIMLGLDASGRRWEFGSSFWILHTAFLPTLAYLALLAVALSQHSLLRTLSWIFHRDPWVRPHSVTAVTLGVISASAFTLKLVLDRI